MNNSRASPITRDARVSKETVEADLIRDTPPSVEARWPGSALPPLPHPPAPPPLPHPHAQTLEPASAGPFRAIYLPDL